MAVALTIWSDGSCPVPGGPGGWAAILLAIDVATGEVLRKRVVAGREPSTTNQRAELSAAIAGLEALERPCEVEVVTDSMYVLLGFADDPVGRQVGRRVAKWKRNGWRRKPGRAPAPTLDGSAREDKHAVANLDLWQRLDAVVATHRVHWVWVRGHNGTALNEEADRLAAEQTRLALEGMAVA